MYGTSLYQSDKDYASNYDDAYSDYDHYEDDDGTDSSNENDDDDGDVDNDVPTAAMAIIKITIRNTGVMNRSQDIYSA